MIVIFDFMSLGQNIKEARLKKKLTQQDLGNTLNSFQNIISQYEKDMVVPSAIVLKQIADKLGVTTDSLLGSKAVFKDKQLIKLMQDIDLLQEEDKKTIIKVIESFLQHRKPTKSKSK